MAELPMRLHPLAPDVKCPACGGDLRLVRVRLLADLYECASPCKRQVLHYWTKETQTCGYSVLYTWEVFGKWTECDMPAAASAKVRSKKAKKAKGK
jgi:hypothetical protein